MTTTAQTQTRRRFIDLPLRTKGVIVIAVPLALLIASLSTVIWADRQGRLAEQQVRTTLEIQSGILELRALIEEASTGVRGYLLTREPAFLQPYTAAKAEMPNVLERMSRSIVDAEQKERVVRIRAQIAQKFERLEDIRQSGTQSPSEIGDLKQALINGKKDLDILRAEIREMTGREAELLSERAEKAEIARSRSRLLMIVAGLFGLLGALFAVTLFSQGIVRRLHALEAQADRLSRGESIAVEDNIRDEIGELERALCEASILLKKREADLRESEERFRLVVEGVRDYGIFALDPDGRVTSWNSGAERITGYTAPEVIGRNYSMFFPPETRELLPVEELDEARQTGRAEREGWRLRKDGSRFQSHTVVTALTDELGRPRGFSKVTRDITERKRFEDEIVRAREDALRASKAKSEFLSRMSHELRTPLNSILGFTQVLELDISDPDQQASLAQILRAGRHLLSLINEVLDIAKIEAGRMEIEIDALDIDEMISQAISLAAPLSVARRIEMSFDAGREAKAAVKADGRRLLQVILNLLSNAIKYNREGGRVEITRMAAGPSMVRIEVRDTGPGIPPESLERLFTPFDRLGLDRGGTEGTGLGLALSKHLIEAMGGEIGVISRAGEGATFFLTLPKADAAAPQALPAKDPAYRSVDPSPEAAHLILYIEDNLANLALVETLVARRSSRLLPSMQGRLGLTLAAEHEPHLILLDLDLPDMGGLDVLRGLRADPRTRRIPVIMVSADPSITSQEAARQAGAFAYLAKPFDIGEFMKTIDEVLSP